MIPSEIICVVSEPEDGPAAAVRGPLRRVLDRLSASGRGPSDVLALTFFVDARDADPYLAAKREVQAAVRAAFESPPPVSVVAQPPEGGRAAALEAAVLCRRSDDIRVSRKSVAGRAYTLLEGMGIRQVYGCAASPDGLTDPVRQSEDACAGAEAILRNESLNWGHVVRQWNYLEDVLDVRGAHSKDHQVYQAFNDIRSVAYGRSSFPAGYPASTGIGQAAGGVIIDLLALSAPQEVRVEPITNPKQIDAHRYSESVLVGDPLDDRSGKTSPKFERAKSVADGQHTTVFVSGTASILGEKSVAIGDVEEQTRVTIEVISSLIAGEKLTHLRAYVKRTADIPAVRAVCEATYGSIPSLYVTADVCRDELLVEIEGARVIPEAPAGDG